MPTPAEPGEVQLSKGGRGEQQPAASERRKEKGGVLTLAGPGSQGLGGSWWKWSLGSALAFTVHTYLANTWGRLCRYTLPVGAP